MQDHDLTNLKRRFALLANEKGIEAAERELFAGLDPLAPGSEALRRVLLGGLMKDERGMWFFPDALDAQPSSNSDSLRR